MIKNIITSAVTALVVVLVVVGLVGGNQPAVGGSQRYPNSDLSAKTITSNGALSATGDATVSGGTLNVVTANTATSTIIGGCYQFYATSTETAHKYQATTTPGLMISVYGTCPNL